MVIFVSEIVTCWLWHVTYYFMVDHLFSLHAGISLASKSGLYKAQEVDVIIFCCWKVTIFRTWRELVVLFPCVREFWENVRQFIPCLRFLIFFKVEISLCTLIPLLCQDQSTVAQWAETTVTKCSLMSCVWTCFLISSHTMPGQRDSQPILTSLGQGCVRV